MKVAVGTMPSLGAVLPNKPAFIALYCFLFFFEFGDLYATVLNDAGFGSIPVMALPFQKPMGQSGYHWRNLETSVFSVF